MNTLQSLTNAQLLQRLAGADAMSLADRPLAELFGLRPACGVRDVEPHSLRAVSDRLAAARELFARALTEQARHQPVCLSSPKEVADLLRLRLGGLAHETFWCVWLDAGHQLIEADEMFRGTIDAAAVYPREVVKTALQRNACAVILAHNHPSGRAEPSAADRTLTDTLRQALALVGVRVLDHFIVGHDQCLSFAECGLL